MQFSHILLFTTLVGTCSCQRNSTATLTERDQIERQGHCFLACSSHDEIRNEVRTSYIFCCFI